MDGWTSTEHLHRRERLDEMTLDLLSARARADRLDPLLALELRLEEGTGAALALPLLQTAVAILSEMATFEAAGVTDAGR
jgi:NaMN:DMB phosphoribosyltransferase